MPALSFTIKEFVMATLMIVPFTACGTLTISFSFGPSRRVVYLSVTGKLGLELACSMAKKTRSGVSWNA